MPIHLEDVEVISKVKGMSSVLIVPCNMCPAVTVAVREDKPFIQAFRSVLKSIPFEKYIESLQARMKEQGVGSTVFRSHLYHHWFLCMWTSGRRKKLAKHARKHEAVVVLGCGSATETVRDSVSEADCKVVEGMKVSGIMNARLKLNWSGNVCFEDCKVTPISAQELPFQ